MAFVKCTVCESLFSRSQYSLATRCARCRYNKLPYDQFIERVRDSLPIARRELKKKRLFAKLMRAK